ncbi:MAG: acyltransferase [Fibromonadaceae bacterium]|jgi:peptidoglycan/LPS O-acetylase OafA/YrhL|nr:acyltransferase [Fibromonadaceae bacterium]
MRNYFPALDSLRFFASINIVLLHFSSSSLLTYAKGTFFWQVVEARYFSTNVFFLLSGFIFSILFSRQDKVPKLKPFLKKRFWRLYPLHITCTLIFFAITIYRTNLLDNTAYALKTLALHISLLWAFVPELGHPLNRPSWALSVFFLCYALTPAFAAFLNRQGKKSLWLLFFGTWIITFLACLHFEELPNIFRSINFFSGMLLGKLFINKHIPLPKKALQNDLFLLLAAVLLYVNVCYLRQVSTGLAYHIVSPVLYCCLLIFLANDKGIIVKMLSLSWLRAVGKASFYTYLLHGVVIEILHLYLDKVAHWKYNCFNNPLATVVIMVLLYGGCTVYSQFKVKGKK